MKRIIIVGRTSSGKSTLARKISKTLGYKYIQLDALFWKKDWGETNDTEFFEKIEKETSEEFWILDGNYTRTRHITWKKADTIIWIDLPFWLTLYQNVSRSINRALTQKELWEGTGNRESFSKMFSSDSIVLWLFKTYSSNRRKYLKDLEDPKYQHLNFIHLKSRKDINQFSNRLQVKE